MSYFVVWRTCQKHRALVEKLIVKNIYTKRFSNILILKIWSKQLNPLFVFIYESKKCHDVKVLNCYLCACPHFRFCDEGLKQEKRALWLKVCVQFLQQKVRSLFAQGNKYLDCSACTLPHTKAFISKHFDRDWKEVMKECPLHLQKVNEKQQ